MFYRNELSWYERRRRSLYECVRDVLDKFLIERALIDSYYRFRAEEVAYPFVQMRELKPKALATSKIEYPQQEPFLIIFCEGAITDAYKKYLRFFDANKLTKSNLSVFADIPQARNFHSSMKYFEKPNFLNLLKEIIPVDYALLIQQDSTPRAHLRYLLSHFHVRVDWTISEAAEGLGKYLRYLSRDLYERGEKYAENLQEKVFEYCGLHHTVAGRRTAGMLAHILLRPMDFLSTVYVASSEARTLYRFAEFGVAKFVLIELDRPSIAELMEISKLSYEALAEHFFVDETDHHAIAIFQTIYTRTSFAQPPAEGRLRVLNTNKNWLSVANQLLMPKATSENHRPINYPIIYT